MISVLETIKQLTTATEPTQLRTSGRYGISTETATSRKLFLFSTPICRQNTKETVDTHFISEKNIFTFWGSNAQISILSTHALLEGQWGTVRLEWEKAQEFFLFNGGKYLRSSDMQIYPTLNGIIVRQTATSNAKIKLQTDIKSNIDVRQNGRYFAYMREKFVPYFTVNAMFATQKLNFHTVELHSVKHTESCYDLNIKTSNEGTHCFVWEANMYEPKLWQDTTVESKHAKKNNAYGSIAFLGRSVDCGIQYLYTRPDLSKIKEEYRRDVVQAIWHVPYYMVNGNSFQLSEPFQRFCSFGSNWSNKVGSASIDTRSKIQNGFVSFDLTDHLVSSDHALKNTQGLVLRQAANEGCSVLATADNYFTPQILELTYYN